MTGDMDVKEVVSPEEWQLRIDLAACYRLVAHFGWSDLIFTHISAKLPGPEHHFLINPYGLMFDEVTASNLIKIDQHCNKILESPYPVNPAGFNIHGAVHAARPEVQCVLHTHTRAGVAVSAQKRGLLPISQQATFVLKSLAYHDYEGVVLNEDELPRLQENLGKCRYLVLRNHGLLTVGRTIADAFMSMYSFESACQIQISAQAGGEELIHTDNQIYESVNKSVKAQTGGIGGQFAWPAMFRMLDRIAPDYKT